MVVSYSSGDFTVKFTEKAKKELRILLKYVWILSEKRKWVYTTDLYIKMSAPLSTKWPASREPPVTLDLWSVTSSILHTLRIMTAYATMF